MKTKKERRKEFLDETVEYYGSDISRRAVDNLYGCSYRTPDGRKCVIGRHIPNEKYSKGIEGDFYMAFKLLPSNIQKLGDEFLNTIQGLHDFKDYWNYEQGKGLSEEGIKRYNELIIYYCL